jgi:hypothetical protein
LTLSYALPRALSENLPLILVHVPPKTTTLLKIWLKHHVLCLLLEVLQHCPSQRRTLLATIGTIDPESSNNIMFNLDNFKSRLSHQLAFQIDVVVHNQQIHRTIG